MIVDASLVFMDFHTLDLDKMEQCGKLSAQAIMELGNITLSPPGCDELTLVLKQEEIILDFHCESFTVLNRTSKYCSKY